MGIFTAKLLELQEAVETSREAFQKKYTEVRLSLSNCACGDSYMQQAINEVCYKAINKYILKVEKSGV